MAEFNYPPINFQTNPEKYKHWIVEYNGDVANVIMNVQLDQPMWEGRYELKSSSYDLAVDIELNDIAQRMRFEHPEVKAVLVSSANDKVFCAGANIPMLGTSPHAFKVNFCKYTNETRCGIEDASSYSGQTWVAALNGTASGGGYELALACEEIYLIDDGNAAVSLPEVPLLGVLPGTGGLTRLTDKRKIRRDISDLFCTKAEGFRANKAVKYKLVDGSYPKSKWNAGMENVANRIIANTLSKNGDLSPMILPEVKSHDEDGTWNYEYVTVELDKRMATVTVLSSSATPERSVNTWSLKMFRELEDALIRLRFNHLNIGLLVVKTEGTAEDVKTHEDWVASNAGSDWFVREIELLQARTLRKLDNMSKSIFALIEEGSCFVGTLFEMALSGDRIYMFLDDDEQNTVQLTEANLGRFPMANGWTRLSARFQNDAESIEEAASHLGEALIAEDALDYGLVSDALDDIDYEDEIRIAIEERLSFSPDALTGMEQNLRFGGAESMENKIYGRLSAWQNWIFQRPNAVGERGALTMYEQPEQPIFDYRRT